MLLENGILKDKSLISLFLPEFFYRLKTILSFFVAVTVIVRLADTQGIKFVIPIVNTDSYDEEKIKYRDIP